MKKCKHNKIDINDLKMVPFQDNIFLNNLLSYFLYKAPSISSIFSEEIDFNDDRFFREYININRFSKIIFMKKYNKNTYIDNNIYGNYICMKCFKIICTRVIDNTDNKLESYLECVLRHIRNSIAHGCVYYLYENKRHYIMFEDFNIKKNLTARIIISRQALIDLKSKLIKYQGD